MNKRVVRLIGTAVLVAFSAGISMGGITQGESGKRKAPRAAHGINGLQELLESIYQCRNCDEDRTARHGGSGWAHGAGWGFPVVIELASNSASTLAMWMATSPEAVKNLNGAAGASGARRSQFTGVSPNATKALAYLGGRWSQDISERAGAFDERRGRSGESHGFGLKSDSLAAVPEPAPIFLLGTILLATFSIARLRFNR